MEKAVISDMNGVLSDSEWIYVVRIIAMHDDYIRKHGMVIILTIVIIITII